MKRLTVSAFQRYLENPDTGHQYIFYGEESFFHTMLLNQLIEKTFTHAGDKELNYHLFYGSDSTITNILSACLSYPMMADRKLVVIKEFEQLSISDKDSFLRYILKPQPTTTLVIIASRWGTTRFHQQLLENCVSVRCNNLRENELYQWAGKKFKDSNIKIAQDAIAFLIENTGQNMQRLVLEIDKIINYIKPKTTLDLTDLSSITGFTREVSVFSFQKELAERSLKNSLPVGLRLLEQGESLAALLPLIFIFFRRMLIVKELILKKLNRKQILEKVSGNAYLYSDIFTNINKFTLEEIIGVLESIENAELEFKSTQKTNSSILTMLCYQICSKKL